MTRPDDNTIDWYKALADAMWLSGSTADTAERNLSRAYLYLLKDWGEMQPDDAEGEVAHVEVDA